MKYDEEKTPLENMARALCEISESMRRIEEACITDAGQLKVTAEVFTDGRYPLDVSTRE